MLACPGRGQILRAHRPGLPMNSFFPMRTGDIVYIALLLAMAVASFLPWSTETTWGPMVALGWMLAALMIVAPVIALIRLFIERRLR